jgi:two-component system response regulator HydG
VSRRILVVDDDVPFCEYLATALRHEGFDVSTTAEPDQVARLVDALDPDVVVADLNLPRSSGLALCTAIAERRPDVPVIVITAFGTLETAIGAIRAGAYDFITKPVEVDALVMTLERALERRALGREVAHLRRTVDDAQGFGELLGTSPVMRDLYELLDRAAVSNASVLVTGESGTGKELVARALHRRSRRSGGPFVAVNCAAIAETLVESELFGHVRGAFTDARGARPGLFLEASGGTILLDEVGELPLTLQPKLLRALQEHVVRPVGSDVEIACDVRVVASTNCDLEALVRGGRFREDLFFRLAVITVAVPPLRARGNDLLVLARHFLRRAAAELDGAERELGHDAVERLLGHDWPGNVRELQNAMQHAAALARGGVVTGADLPARLLRPPEAGDGVPEASPSRLAPLHEVERSHVLRVLEAMQGNKTAAAQVLEVDRKTLLRKLRHRVVDGRAASGSGDTPEPGRPASATRGSSQ